MPAPILVLHGKPGNPQHFSFQFVVTKKYKEAPDEMQNFFLSILLFIFFSFLSLSTFQNLSA